MSTAPALGNWHGRLQLEFAHCGTRTALVRRRHFGPLAMQKPFYPEGPVCHSYLLHPPGGIAAGDALEIQLTIHDQAHVLVTTPAAGKFYRSDGAHSGLSQLFEVGDGATLEWLPQETIVFPGCQARQTTHINLRGNACCIAWDISCLGRPACNEAFSHGEFRQHLELYRDGRPLLIERNLFHGGSRFLDAAWGMGGNAAIGTLVATGADHALRDALRETCAAGAMACEVTLLDDLLICRALGPGVRVMQQNFQALWRQLRPPLLGRAACTPRIWLT